MKLHLQLTGVNLSLVGFGFILLVIGLFRTVPITVFDKKGLQTWGPIWGMFVISAVIIYMNHGRHGGTKGIMSGLEKTLMTSAAYLPMILGFFFTMGFMSIVVDCYRERIVSSLAGNHGFVSALATSFVLPSSTTIGPEIKGLWHSTPALRGVLTLIFIDSSLVSIPLFYIRTMGTDWGTQWRMYVVGVFTALILVPVLMLAKAIGIL